LSEKRTRFIHRTMQQTRPRAESRMREVLTEVCAEV